MMDPGQQPTTDDVRDLSRKQRNAPRQERPSTITQAGGSSASQAAREDALSAGREELRVAEERYRELFDFAPDAYLITDVYGTIGEANFAAGKLLGVEARSLTGKRLPAFFDERSRKEYRHQLDRICDFDRLDDWEIVLQTRSGERVAASVSIARASTRQKAVGGYRWILRDITKRVRADEALRESNRELELRVASRTAQLAAADRMKDELLLSEHKAREDAEIANRVNAEFLALLSHEFRTPLQAIFGYTELLERQIHGPLNEAQLGDLRRIQQSQQHLLGLIGTILDFARLDSGEEVEVHLCPTVVDEILRDMEGFIDSQLEKRKLSYRYDCSNATITAQSDPARVQQIVLNLLANSLKFTPSGGQISLECTRERNSVAIRVIDSGIGIPEDKLETVFEPFVQIRNSESASEGIGLGLSISRRLATAMGGTLTASSNAEQGSTFTLRLPLATA